MKRLVVWMSVAHLIVVLCCAGRLAVAAQESVIYGVVQQRQDALAGGTACAVVDAQSTRAVDLDAAVRALGPCMQDLSQRYGVTVNAVKGAVGVDGGRSTAAGILIQVPAEIRKDCHVLMDLSYSVREKRKGLLFGLPAGVWSGALEPQDSLSAESVAAIPAWLDGASLKLDTKLTKLRQGVELRVVLFDKDDNEVELTSAAAAPSGEASVTFTKATDEELGPYKAAGLDAAAPGALRRTLSAVPIPAELDAHLRKAVQGLFERLPGGGAK
jgi:hypothetical protein